MARGQGERVEEDARCLRIFWMKDAGGHRSNGRSEGSGSFQDDYFWAPASLCQLDTSGLELDEAEITQQPCFGKLRRALACEAAKSRCWSSSGVPGGKELCKYGHG